MSLPESSQYLLFSLDNQQYAVPVGMVERVVRAVLITRLAEAPAWLEGIITVMGQVVPVVSLRQRFHLPHRPLQLDDRLVICYSPQRLLAFLVDRVQDVVSLPRDIAEQSGEIFPHLDDFIAGAGKLSDETVLIYDFDRLLTRQQLSSLEKALAPLEKEIP